MKRAEMQAQCTVSLNSKRVLEHFSWTPKLAKFRNELKRAETQKRRTVSLNSYCVCVYCSWRVRVLWKTMRSTIWWKRCVYYSLHKHNYHLIKIVQSVQRLFSLSLAFFFSLNYRGRMSSKLFNTPSESFSMNCTYPPTTKPSKQSTHGTSKPITRNSLKRSPLFFLCLSSLSLRLGHCCRHCGCGSLHSRVSCI